MREVRRIAVVGAGTMGNGIAHVAAQHGFDVVLIDVAASALQQAVVTIEANLDRQVRKGTLGEDVRTQTLARLTTDTDRHAAADADVIVEAVPESASLKFELFRELDALAPKAVLASNTSSLSITALARQVADPGRVIGMHFMNPVPVMKLVEVIRGLQTTQDTMDTVLDLARRLDKTPIEAKDFPGFVSNRVLMPMINEAVFCLMEGVAEAEAIDTVMKLGMNHPLGPLALADLIGLDTCLAILEVLQRELGDDKYRPCPLLRNYVAAGWLGRKSGRGFYSY